MDIALIVTLVFSILSTLLAGIELLIAFFNHRKERTVQVVTEQRSKWIQELRNLFAEVIDHLDYSIDSMIHLAKQLVHPSLQSPQPNFYIYELRKNYVKLRLLLNFENEIDKELLNTIEDLICRIDINVSYSYIINYGDYNIEEFVAEKELISLYMSMYLKAEWERLKKESKTGKANSSYFEVKHKELIEKNKVLIKDLSEKAFRIELEKLKEFIESDPQFRGKDITTYNCLNIIDKRNDEEPRDKDI